MKHFEEIIPFGEKKLFGINEEAVTEATIQGDGKYPGKKIVPGKAPYDPKDEKPINFVVTVVTKERLEKAKIKREKTGLPSREKDFGYHFACATQKEAEDIKAKYKKGDTYKGETISSVTIRREHLGSD